MPDDDDHDWRGRPRAKRDRDDGDDDRDPPCRRRRDVDYDDDDDRDRPRRRRRDDDYYDDDRYHRLPDHRGGLVLAFGIMAWILCGIFGIVAFIMGTSDIRAMKEGRMDPSGKTLTEVGRWIGLGIFLLQTVVGIAYLLFVVAVLGLK
jgi:hypothetical protein